VAGTFMMFTPNAGLWLRRRAWLGRTTPWNRRSTPDPDQTLGHGIAPSCRRPPGASPRAVPRWTRWLKRWSPELGQSHHLRHPTCALSAGVAWDGQ